MSKPDDRQLNSDDQILLIFRIPGWDYNRLYLLSDRLINSVLRKILDRVNGKPWNEIEDKDFQTLYALFNDDDNLILDKMNMSKYEVEPAKFKDKLIHKIIEVNLV